MSNNKLPVGSVKVRTRHKRGHEQRAWIKVAEPNEWILMARYVWEQTNGPIPPGMGIHHKDENKLNDELTNLELVSKSEHMKIHRPDFNDRRIQSFTVARREKRWSTKSQTKRTGRPPTYDENQMSLVIEEWQQTGAKFVTLGRKYGISPRIIAHRIKELNL